MLSNNFRIIHDGERGTFYASLAIRSSFCRRHRRSCRCLLLTNTNTSATSGVYVYLYS